MQTTMTVDGYNYTLVEYAYTTNQGDLVGYSKSPDIKFAGEIKEIPDDHEWLTPLTAIERAPLGDTFLMEGVEGEAAITRADLEKELEEEKWLESRRVKPGWQPFITV
jgi:hypothetical protein